MSPNPSNNPTTSLSTTFTPSRNRPHIASVKRPVSPSQYLNVKISECPDSETKRAVFKAQCAARAAAAHAAEIEAQDAAFRIVDDDEETLCGASRSSMEQELQQEPVATKKPDRGCISPRFALPKYEYRANGMPAPRDHIITGNVHCEIM